MFGMLAAAVIAGGAITALAGPGASAAPVSLASLALLTSPASLASPAAPATSAVGGQWGAAQAIPGWAALKSPDGNADAISCASAGNCVVGGGYANTSDVLLSFLDSETDGKWGNVQEVPGLAALEAHAVAFGGGAVASVSCPSAGNCAITGGYSDGAGSQQAYVATEAGGKWGNAEPIPYLAVLNAGKDATVTQVSCASAGNCAVSGAYSDGAGHQQAFVDLELAGHWQDADSVLVPSFNAGGDAEANAVSCPAVNDCVVGGQSTDAHGFKQSWVAYQVGAHSWSEWEPPGTTSTGSDGDLGGVSSLSCSSAGNCVVVGSYLSGGTPVPYLLNDDGGAWDNAASPLTGYGLPADSPGALTSVSCSSSTECVATGSYSSGQQAIPFEIEEQRQDWGSVLPLAGLNFSNGGSPSAVSCGTPGNCAIGGTTDGSTEVAFVEDETAYGWNGAEQVPHITTLGASDSATNAVSCTAPGNCSAAGFYDAKSGLVPFVVDRTWSDPTATTLTVSPGPAVYGHEQSVHATVTVRPQAYLLPGGTVTVKAGGTALCTAHLAVSTVTGAGAGSCPLPAAKLAAGGYTLTATYNGAAGYAPSTSGHKALTVAKAKSATALTLAHGSVQYGHETSEKLSVTVGPQFAGTPGGTVKITSGTTVIAVITLKSGHGSCTLKASQLKAGSHPLTATYQGNGDFGASSAKKTLTITS
jgi:hypothetical protein